MNIIETKLKKNGNLTYNNYPNKIVLHNADASSCTIEDVNDWHLANGWTMVGYHFLVRKDGSVYRGRPENAQGSHCPGANTSSIGICFEGKYMEETMPSEQYEAGLELITYLFDKYGTLAIYGHKDLYSTDCPGTNFPLNDFKNMKVGTSRVQGWNKNETGWWYCTNVEEGYYYKDVWRLIDGEFYSFDSDGYARQTTWLQDGGKWYYLKDSCKMAKSEWLWINGECYCFDEHGTLYMNCITPDGYTTDSTGAWDETIPQKK